MAKVEVQVGETTEEVEHCALSEATRKLFLASLGAVSLALEVIADSFTKLVERGEQAEEEGKKLVHERMEERRHQVRKVVRRGREEAGVDESALEKQVEDLLGRMNVPTKKDINALSAKITALTKKVDELKQAQTGEEGSSA